MNHKTHEHNPIKAQLQDLLGSEYDTLKREVIEEALDYETDDEIRSFFTDLLAHGCISGMVGKLIYYTDTHAFYDKHYDKIEELRYDYAG